MITLKKINKINKIIIENFEKNSIRMKQENCQTSKHISNKFYHSLVNLHTIDIFWQID